MKKEVEKGLEIVMCFKKYLTSEKKSKIIIHVSRFKVNQIIITLLRRSIIYTERDVEISEMLQNKVPEIDN